MVSRIYSKANHLKRNIYSQDQYFAKEYCSKIYETTTTTTTKVAAACHDSGGTSFYSC